MPIYDVTNEETGVTLEMEGERPPTKEDVVRAFAFAGKQKYPDAPVLQAPPSLFERAKAVAPSLVRVAAPFATGLPTPQDIATTGRVLQQGSEAVRRLTGGVEKPEELLQGASRIEREGIMALGGASQEKREQAARLGGRLGETVSKYTPIPEYVTRPAGEVMGQVSADLLSPINVMSLGIAGAARQATRIPSLIAGTQFAETTTPAAARTAQIADLLRASEAARASEQVGKTIPRLLVPEITRGSAESSGIALQTIADPNATPEEKLKASYEAIIGTLFAAGLGAQVIRSLGMRGKGVTQADVLENLASQKKTVGEAIGQVSGLIDQMDRIVPVENLKDQFRKFTSELNPDEPFIYQRETAGEGVRERTKFLTEKEQAALRKEEAAVEQQKKADEAGQQAALEQVAEFSGTRLKSAEELFLERNRPPVIEDEAVQQFVREQVIEQTRREAAIKSRRESAQDVGRLPLASSLTQEAQDLLIKVDKGGVPGFITNNLKRIATENGVTINASDTPNSIINKLRQKGAAESEVVTEPTSTTKANKREIVEPEAPETLRTQEQILAERLRARDERIAAQEQAALEREAAKAGTPLRTAKEVQAQRAIERQAQRERSAAIRKAIGRREFTVADLMREEAVAEVPVEPTRAPIITPELTVERAATREGGMLPPRETEVAPAPEGTALRSVEDLLAERLRLRDERIAAEQEAAARTSTPLETVEQKLSRALAARDKRLAAEAVADALESGAAQGEPVRITRKKVEEAVGIGRKEAGQAVAERTIFNEVWEKALQETQGKPKPVEPTIPQLTEQPAQRMKLFVDGIEGQTVSPDQVPNGNAAFEYAVGSTTEGGGTAIYRRSVSEKGTYGGWRWEADANKLKQPKPESFRQKAEGVAEKLEGLRTQVEPGLGANPFPQLMGAAWNGSLSVAQAFIRAGGSVADAVAAGLRYARQNFKGKFNEAEFVAQLTRTIQRPSPIQVPPKMEARAFSERLAAAPGIPPQMREAIAQSPESSYLRQNQDAIKREAAAKTNDQLISDIANPESNTKTIDSLELVNRMLAEGKIDEATALGTSLSKNLTTAGQIINQAKLLNSTTRTGFIFLVDKTLQKFGKKLNSEQASKLGDAIDQYRNASNQLEAAKLNWKNAADNNDLDGIKKNRSLANLADAKKIEADVVLAQLLARINPASAGSLYLATVQGSVLSPKSIEGGVLGNLMGYPLREVSDVIAATLDSVYGNENNSYKIRARTVTRLSEFFKSLPEAWKIIIKGSDAMPYEVGNVIGNPLNAQRAFGRLIEDLRNNALISKSTPRNFYEAVFGAIPDLFLRFTQAIDFPFRKAERAVAIEEMAGRRRFSDSQVELAKRHPELFLISDKQKQSGRKGFTEKDIGEIEFESLSRIFQQENTVTRGFSAINSALQNRFGNIAYVPYRIASTLFQKTPINFAAEIITYTPLGLLQYADWANLSTGKKQKIISKVLVGSSIMYASNYLYDKGVVTPNLDTPGDTNKARELAKAGGVMPPGSLNVSGLRRLVKGGNPAFRPGDTVKDLSRMGTLGGLMMIQATSKRLDELARTDDPDYFTKIKGTVISGINFLNQQQFLKGAADTIKVLSQESDLSLDRWLRSFVVTAASPFAPNILGLSRRAQREYQPSIGHEGFAKDAVNELNQRYAALGLAIPGAKNPNAMPVRRDLWGDAVEQTPKGENPWVYNLFSAWNSREIEADPLNASIYTLWRRTADNSAIPSIPNPKITYENQTYNRMSPEQYDRYSQLVGFYRRKASEYAFTHGAYHQGTDEVKLEILKDAYDRGFKIGKYWFIEELRKSGQSLTPLAPRRGFQEQSDQE